MKKSIMIGLFSCLLIVLSACDGGEETQVWSVSMDWPSYDSIDEMTERATDVVRVEVLSSTITRWAYEGSDFLRNIYTFYTIHVLEVFQGNLQVGDEIEVAQLGGKLDNVEMINRNRVPFEIGDELVMFLVFFPEKDYPAGILNPWQGIYRLSEEVGYGEEIDPSIALIPLHDEGNYSTNFELTVEDLIEIAKENDLLD